MKRYLYPQGDLAVGLVLTTSSDCNYFEIQRRDRQLVPMGHTACGKNL